METGAKLSSNTGKILALAGLCSILVGIFFADVILSVLGIILGLLALLSPERKFGAIVIAMGVIRLVLSLTNIL